MPGINTPRRLADALEQLVTDATGSFAEGIQATERHMFRRLQTSLRDLTTDGAGNIQRTAANRARLRKIKKSLESAVLTDAYQGRVSKFLGAFNLVGQMHDEYFSALSEAFKPDTALFDELRRAAIDITTNSLTGAGIQINVIDPVSEILNTNITTGGNVFELEEQLRDRIISNEGGLGALSRYTGQITRDSLNQFSANYHQSITEDLGLEWYLYAPGKVAGTRSFCAKWQGKYFHKSEIADMIKTPWPGMIKGTNSSNFLTYRGGYNCMHQASAVLESAVPAADRARVGGVSAAIESSGGVAPDGFEFMPDLPQEIRDQLTFNGNHPNMPTEFDFDYGVNLPDQFWDQFDRPPVILDLGESAYYDPNEDILNISPSSGRYISSERYRRSIFAHELGHKWHYDKKFIYAFKDEYGRVSFAANDGFRKVYKDFRTKLNEIYGNEEAWGEKVYHYLMKDGKHVLDPRDGGRISLSEHLAKKLGLPHADVDLMYGQTADTIAALTRGRQGFGHSDSYWKFPGKIYEELFAHLNENFWVGNPVFKELYPEIYEAGIEFMKNLYGF